MAKMDSTQPPGKTKISDNQMFGRNWWLCPLSARYESIAANEAGLAVTVEVSKRASHRDEELCIVWRGSEAQFRNFELLKRHTATFPARVRWTCAAALRGYLRKDGVDQFSYVIEYCYERGRPGKHVKRAMQDSTYLRFRDRLLTPLLIDDDGMKS